MPHKRVIAGKTYTRVSWDSSKANAEKRVSAMKSGWVKKDPGKWSFRIVKNAAGDYDILRRYTGKKK